MPARLLVDTNLLVLLIVGSASRDYIASHKRTSGYTAADFDLLVRLLDEATAILTTPHILCETSNLVRQFGGPGVLEVVEVFRRFVEAVSERPIRSADAVGHVAFPRLGLTDAASLLAQDDGVTLLTDDFKLYAASALAGRKAVNFAHERAANPG